tara:strand:+ start:1672 stop:2805 length:1134 start_codon:yes stop_codon:yes gene_type:complete
MKKRILFITGTRADYGKIKPILKLIINDLDYEIKIFVSGMHTDVKYGETYIAILRDFPENTEVFFNNTKGFDSSSCCAEMIHGINRYLKNNRVDLVVVHGDRVEALAASISSRLNNVLVAHLEGGEKSGTIDESIRHAISKFANYHFVCNEAAFKTLALMGEDRKTIFNIGSADMDFIIKGNIPPIEETFNKYDIEFSNYGIILFHPVTTDVKGTIQYCEIMIEAIIDSGKNFIIIDPNNDLGSDEIRNLYSKSLNDLSRFKRFPSVDFEHFISLLRRSSLLIGNSSAGIRESPYLKVSSINLGTRQDGRLDFCHPSIYNYHYLDELSLKDLIINSWNKRNYPSFSAFGSGNTAIKFKSIIDDKNFWEIKLQKKLSY